MPKTEEKKIEEGVTVGYEMKPMEAASTEEYTLWSVEKVWTNAEFQVGQESHRVGFNFIPTYNHEVIVAMPRQNAVELPAGAISAEDLNRQMEKLADAMLAYRKRIITEGKSAGF